MACAARIPLARPSRRAVCAWPTSCSTTALACAPVSVPFVFIAPSTCSHAGCRGLLACDAFVTAAKNTSSIFSRLPSASFSWPSFNPAPRSTNWASALRFASTACSSAASMPANALLSKPSTSIALAGFCAAPAEVACVTLLTTLRMLASVNSRPCSAFRVASATALRIASPCLALACANIAMRASWSIPDFIMAIPCLSEGGCRATRGAGRTTGGSLHVLAAVDGDVGACQERRLLGGQIDDQARHFLGLAQATDRDLRQDLRIEDLLRDRRHHRRADVAG